MISISGETSIGSTLTRGADEEAEDEDVEVSTTVESAGWSHIHSQRIIHHRRLRHQKSRLTRSWLILLIMVSVQPRHGSQTAYRMPSSTQTKLQCYRMPLKNQQLGAPRVSTLIHASHHQFLPAAKSPAAASAAAAAGLLVLYVGSGAAATSEARRLITIVEKRMMLEFQEVKDVKRACSLILVDCLPPRVRTGLKWWTGSESMK